MKNRTIESERVLDLQIQFANRVDELSDELSQQQIIDFLEEYRMAVANVAQTTEQNSSPPLKRIVIGTEEVPEEVVPVLAKIEHITSLGKSTWYEVVYHNGSEWRAYEGSTTFTDGEKVVKWKFAQECL